MKDTVKNKKKLLKKLNSGVCARDRSERITMYIVFPLLLIWSITLIYPFAWALLNTFKTPVEFYRDSFALPEVWQFENWVKAFTFLQVPKGDPWEKAGFFELVWNSIWMTFGSAIIGMFSVSCLAYVTAKYSCKWTRLLYKISVMMMIIPLFSGGPSLYKLYFQLGLVNTPLRLLTAIGSGMGGMQLLILYSFFVGVSWTYAEAVFIDGGGHWTVFFKIMLPQAMPILTALFVTTCISGWNDYMTSLMYMNEYPTLATGLYIVETGSLTANNKPIYFACILLSVIPVIAVFWIFCDKIMTNVSVGGLKG